MPRRLVDKNLIAASLLHLLRRNGPQVAGALPDLLGVSHATISRIIKVLDRDLVILGRGRATKYAARRSIPSTPDVLPIFEILPDGSSRQLGTLTAVMPNGYVVHWNPKRKDTPEFEFFSDLPYFVDDMRPSGFLGRMVPQRHPDLDLPSDISLWSSDVCLRYLSQQGWNTSGSLIIGDDAFRRYLEHSAKPADCVEESNRNTDYPDLATNLLRFGAAGSSAAGEQPKFLVTRLPDAVPIIVKFSPLILSDVGRRLADLLICEHLALETMRSFGFAAAKTNVILTANRVFLEVERFDRTATGGRRGIFSLASLNAQFVGTMTNWTETTNELAKLGRIPKICVEKTQWYEHYSQLIGNTDRHFGNLAFFACGLEIEDLAPAYDVLPMAFAPRGHQIFDQQLKVSIPTATEARIWTGAADAAISFWSRVIADKRISTEFRSVATNCREVVECARKQAQRLPVQQPN